MKSKYMNEPLTMVAAGNSVIKETLYLFLGNTVSAEITFPWYDSSRVFIGKV